MKEAAGEKKRKLENEEHQDEDEMSKVSARSCGTKTIRKMKMFRFRKKGMDDEIIIKKITGNVHNFFIRTKMIMEN